MEPGVRSTIGPIVLTAGIEETGLGLSDFGVRELLLHKGPLPAAYLVRARIAFIITSQTWSVP
jgi:hypothetical protein